MSELAGGASAPRGPSAVVIVLAKAPVPGEAKTRLIPALGADGAATLAERLLFPWSSGAERTTPGI